MRQDVSQCCGTIFHPIHLFLFLLYRARETISYTDFNKRCRLRFDRFAKKPM